MVGVVITQAICPPDAQGKLLAKTMLEMKQGKMIKLGNQKRHRQSFGS